MNPAIGECGLDSNPIGMVESIYNTTNEVFMVDTGDIWLNLYQFTGVNETFRCVHETGACVISGYYYSLDKGADLPLASDDPFESKGSVDVLINRDKREGRSLYIPGINPSVSDEDIIFNTCKPKVHTVNDEGNPVPSLNPDHGYDNYQLMVHEAGHAFGDDRFIF